MNDRNPASGTGGRKGSFLTNPVGCTAVGLAGNIGLSGAKIALGLLAGSTALLADGYHSLADVLSDIGILLALKTANLPPDENHPYGHQSFETLGAVAVAAFMLLAAFIIGRGAILEIIHRDHEVPQMIALWTSLGSVIIKEVMARYTIFVGRKHNSPALLANGAMHRSDAISSLAAVVGIGGAQFGWPILDSAAALVIAILITRMGWNLMRDNIMALMDTVPSPELVTAIGEAAAHVPCVQEVIDIKVRQRGSHYLTDLRIAIHPRHTIGEAHDIAHLVEKEVLDRVKNVTRVFVHVEPGALLPEHVCSLFNGELDHVRGEVSGAGHDRPEPR